MKEHEADIIKLLVLCLFLAACTGTPTPQPQLVYSTPLGNGSLAGQEVYLRASQVALEANIAQASQVAAVTQQAANGTATERAFIITQAVIAGTSGAATATQAADNLALAIAQGGATQSAVETSASWSATQAALSLAPDQTQQAATATQATQATRQTDKARSDTFFFWAFALFILALLAITLYYFTKAARAVSAKLTPANDTNQIRVLRLNVGTLVLSPLPGGGVGRELIPLPGAPVELPDEDSFSTDEEPGEDVPLFVGGNLKTFFDRDEMDTEHDANEASRARALKFLRRCIEVNGPESDLVPGHRALKMGGGAVATGDYDFGRERSNDSRRGDKAGGGVGYAGRVV
jgi:hypothetical protein